MTNYNERLDDIFAPIIDSPSLTLTTTYWDEAKQAITSLIKELMAEAKPNREDKTYTNPIYNTEQDSELREKLAAIEHQRWADWQRYVHSLCYENKGIGGELTGELTIPSELVRRWERQIETPYHELSEKEKDSDREQVDRYWQLITADRKRVALEARLDELEQVYPQLQKHHGVSGEGNYYYDDRIAQLKAQQEEVK